MIGYALRDYDDTLGIERVCYYNPRYDVPMTWDLDYFLDQCAGRRVDLKRMRQDFRELLEQEAEGLIELAARFREERN